jgi:formate dehydrogenase iron-sulfur subunit
VDHVYGESEAGGTAWLYLSAVPFAQLGLPTRFDRGPERQPDGSATAAGAPALLGVGVVASGLAWYTRRRGRVAASEGSDTERNASTTE